MSKPNSAEANSFRRKNESSLLEFRRVRFVLKFNVKRKWSMCGFVRCSYHFYISKTDCIIRAPLSFDLIVTLVRPSQQTDTFRLIRTNWFFEQSAIFDIQFGWFWIADMWPPFLFMFLQIYEWKHYFFRAQSLIWWSYVQQLFSTFWENTQAPTITQYKL